MILSRLWIEVDLVRLDAIDSGPLANNGMGGVLGVSFSIPSTTYACSRLYTQ